MGTANDDTVRGKCVGTLTKGSFSSGSHQLRITARGAIDFTPGFTPKVVHSIDKAHRRPLKSVETYIMVNMTGLEQPGRSSRISLVNRYGDVIYTGDAIQVR